MRAYVCDHWGEPDEMQVVETEPPVLGDGNDLRIAVKAAGVNFADILMVRGEYQVKPPFPFSPGLELAGEVQESTDPESPFKPGQRVLSTVGNGGFATEAVASSKDTIAIPDSMDFASAAGFPIVYGSSHIGLVDKLKLQAGETLLVHGAAGGVGLTAVEIAKKLGAMVIATAGGPDKLAVAKRYGADHLIDYREEDIRDRVKELTDGRGVDAVYDPVGGSAFEATLRCVAPFARILIVGFASGTVPRSPT